jgi:hypothetical protein
MSRFAIGLFVAGSLLAAVPLPASADEILTEGTATGDAARVSFNMDMRSQANDWMIMPEGVYTVSGRMSFLTAPESPLGGTTDGAVRFTDVMLMGFEARSSLGKRGEVAMGLDILPKQPSFTDEAIWQRLSFGGRLGFKKRYAAFADVTAGPLLGAEGLWGAGGAGVQVRKSIHETLVFQLSGGGSFTGLAPDGMSAMDDSAWFVEALAGGEMVFKVPNGMMAGWLGTQLRFPVAHGESGMGPNLEPHTRANVTIGTVLSYIDDWDIFAELSIVDRGDLVRPETTLPILDGGFDQTQLMVGLTRRFKRDKAPPNQPLMMIP